MALTPDNVAGLVVGEGCFYVESAADPKYRSGWRIRPGFCIEMRHDERALLEEVKAIVGCGAIYELDFGRYRGYEDRGWLPHVKFRVGSVADLHAHVVPFFRTHPLFGRKREAFDIFAEIVEGLHAREHLTEIGLKRLKRQAFHLMRHNQRGGGAAGEKVARWKARYAPRRR